MMTEGIQEYYKPSKIFDFPAYISTAHSAYYTADRTKEISGSNIAYYDNPTVKDIMFEKKTNAGLGCYQGSALNLV